MNILAISRALQEIGKAGETASAEANRWAVAMHFFQFFVIVAMIGGMILFLRNQKRKECVTTTQLLEDASLEDEELPATKKTENEWERDADWWKKDSPD